mgnify:CR=1 FL=1
MKIIVTGCRGQLGTEIIKQLREGRSELGPIPEKLVSATVIPVDLPELDITNYKMVDDFIRRQRPDVIINCAAFTNVDGCEVNHDAAFKANAIGPRNLAQAATKTGARLVHVSTDYVFSGRENGGIPQDEATIPGPISAYGSTKLMGEKYVEQFCHRHFIVRTAWLYSYYGKNFVKTIVNAGKKFGKLEVVNDQCGNPTNAVDLAHEILQLCVTHEYGLSTTAPARASVPGMISHRRSSACPAWTPPCLPALAKSTRQSTRTAPTAPSGALWTTGCSAAPSATTSATGRTRWPASSSTGTATTG